MDKIYSFKCGECGRQLAKFSDRESFIRSGIQIMCWRDKKINFSLPRNIAGSVNYALGKILEFTRRNNEKLQTSNQNTETARV